MSILVGLFALVGAVIGLVPLLGWANWFVLPIAALGALLGLLSRSSSGMYFCLIVLGIASLRLFVGGGII